jgi:hypothetical protein
MRCGLLVENYLAGPEILRRAISGMTDDQINATPIPFKWSSRQVVLHLADMDLVFADHMKRIIAEEEPVLAGVPGKAFASRLAYEHRDVDEEVRLIMAIRRHMGHILRSIDADDFKRKGIHSREGQLTLTDILQRAIDHIPHHARYIEEKRKALNIGERAIPFHLASLGVMERSIA